MPFSHFKIFLISAVILINLLTKWIVPAARAVSRKKCLIFFFIKTSSFILWSFKNVFDIIEKIVSSFHNHKSLFNNIISAFYNIYKLIFEKSFISFTYFENFNLLKKQYNYNCSIIVFKIMIWYNVRKQWAVPIENMQTEHACMVRSVYIESDRANARQPG